VITWRAPVARTVAQRQRRTIRYLAAAIAAITAVMYLLIGFGALLLLTLDNRILWVLGALLQVGIIAIYMIVGQERTPAFETWGITIKILQVILLGALLSLVFRPPEREDEAAT
jgi:hypothetical protein